MRDGSRLTPRSVRRLRLFVVGLLLLGLLAGATGIGHDHVDSGSSHDTCAVCVHARTVTVAAETAVPLDPIVLATPVPVRALRVTATGRVVRLRGRAPPRSTSSSC